MRTDGMEDDLDDLPERPRQVIPAADRELLELAARALGAVRVEDVDGENWVNLYFADGTVVHCWNPLLYYGDTFELAVRAGLSITQLAMEDIVDDRSGSGAVVEPNNDRLANAARAVVRAATEIGKDVEAPSVSRK